MPSEKTCKNDGLYSFLVPLKPWSALRGRLLESGFQSLTNSSIIKERITAGFFWFYNFILEKFTKNGVKLFSIIALVLMVLSFINPFMGMPNVTLAYALVLNLMHLVVAGAVLYFLGKAVKKTHLFRIAFQNKLKDY